MSEELTEVKLADVAELEDIYLKSQREHDKTYILEHNHEYHRHPWQLQLFEYEAELESD